MKGRGGGGGGGGVEYKDPILKIYTDDYFILDKWHFFNTYMPRDSLEK